MDLVQKLREQRHKGLGWSSSDTPNRFYIQDHQALASGPLFWDIAASDEKFKQLLQAKGKAKFQKSLCRSCGFPSCACEGCGDQVRLGKEHKLKTKHICWRAQQGSGNPGKGDPCRIPEAISRRSAAWKAVGCDMAVSWNSAAKEYEL